MNNEEIVLESKNYADQEVTPKDLLRLAKGILMVVSGLFVLGMLCRLINHDAIIFEACKTILPPVATMVIGFYFGKSN
jgi:hypothetical protein